MRVEPLRRVFVANDGDGAMDGKCYCFRFHVRTRRHVDEEER